MTRTLLAIAALTVWMAPALDAQPAGVPEPARRASVPTGSIQGTVTDPRGRVLQGALVSALGVSTEVATTDALGQFALHGLPPGSYILRAHSIGFVASDREIVDLRPSGRLVRVFQLQPLGADPFDAAPGPTVLAAGLAGAPEPGARTGEADAGTGGDHSHTPTAWRLRHLKRSVLRDASGAPLGFSDEDAAFDPEGAAAGHWFDWALESSSRLAQSLADVPFSGELNLLTAGSYGSPQEWFSAEHLPRGVAFLSLGAPAGGGSWSMRAAVAGGGLSSWILAGSYAATAGTHVYDVGVSYGTQAYKGGKTAPLSDIAEDSRNVGAVYGFDRWQVSRAVALDYGAHWSRYDYVEQPNLLSPRFGVTVSPTGRTHVRARVSQQMLAPGAEEFLPPSAGLWLPPERTFAPLGADRFRVERVRTVEIAVERELEAAFVVAVRRFHQNIDDQLATIFGAGGPLGVGGGAGHYHVATAGSIESHGWGVRFSSPIDHRVRGSVDYSLTRASWAPSVEVGVLDDVVPSIVRLEGEEIHDVTTSLEAAIPETATRVCFVYRLNSAFARADGEPRPGFDGRFDLVVNQGLPFRLVSSEWEVLVGVRNLFRDRDEFGSSYDELLVVRPPTRVIGGFLVRF